MKDLLLLLAEPVPSLVISQLTLPTQPLSVKHFQGPDRDCPSSCCQQGGNEVCMVNWQWLQRRHGLPSGGNVQLPYHYDSQEIFCPSYVCLLSHFSRVCNSLWPYGHSLPVSSVRGILQARILEWVAMHSSRGSSWPRDRTRISYVSCSGWQFLYH